MVRFGEPMRLRLQLFLILSPLFITGLFGAQQWWEEKPFMDWTSREVSKVLHDSPWADMVVGRLSLIHPKRLRPTRRNPWPACYCVRLLSAKPVRDGLLRLVTYPGLLTFAHDPNVSVVNVEDLKTTYREQGKAQLARFMSSNPDDIRLKGDEENIVIGITIARYEPSVGAWKWFHNPVPWKGLRFSDIADKTLLSTETGKQMRVGKYERPLLDYLGAKYYFPRELPDGRPLVSLDDGELLFETEIDGKRIRAKFDVKKLVYEGRLEI
jgi:hypothetical protein